MKAAAVVLCAIAVVALLLAIRDMVLGTGGAGRGWALRAIAVVAFAVAVVLNVLAS
jgi:hypothetical protein